MNIQTAFNQMSFIPAIVEATQAVEFENTQNADFLAKATVQFDEPTMTSAVTFSTPTLS